MSLTDDWIDEFVSELNAISLEVKIVSRFCLLINGQCVNLAPADTLLSPEKSNGILVHEDIYRTRKKQVIQRIKSKTGQNQRKIHGRLTRVKSISSKEAKQFVNDNHVMGFGGGKVCYGLLYLNELVAVAIFSNTRLMKYENPPYLSTELVRFCSLADTTVIGGLNKLIHHFCKHHLTDDIVTTVDREWSDGEAYKKTGFDSISVTDSLFFGVDSICFTRRNLKSQTDLKENEYLVQNQGNIKLRKLISRQD